jgi:hypothetical protein
MKSKQISLFTAELADTMAKVSAIDDGITIEFNPMSKCRIDRNGIALVKHHFVGDVVKSTTEIVCKFPIIPLRVLHCREETYVEILYSGLKGPRIDIVELQALKEPWENPWLQNELSVRGLFLTGTQWKTIAPVVMKYLKTMVVDLDLPIVHVSGLKWTEVNSFLIERKTPLRLLAGGGSSVDTNTKPVLTLV